MRVIQSAQLHHMGQGQQLHATRGQMPAEKLRFILTPILRNCPDQQRFTGACHGADSQTAVIQSKGIILTITESNSSSFNNTAVFDSYGTCVFRFFPGLPCIAAAEVDLIELRIAKGMCGKSYMTLTGSVSAVGAAIEKAKAESADRGMFLDSAVIARPSDKLSKYIM